MLTTGVDISGNLVGSAGTTSTAGNDTFIADNTQTNKVTSAADALNGGAGVDTLTVYGELASNPQISNIEKVVLDSFADTKTANLSTISGITNVTLSKAAGEAGVTVADGVSVAVENNAYVATKDLTVTYGSTDTSANLSLNKVTLTASGDNLVVNGTNVATLNISTSGSASTIGTFDGTAALTKLVVTGDKDLTFVDALEVSVATVDASAFTGKLSVVSTNNAATQDAATAGVDTTDLTIKGGSGNDTINIAANAADNEVSVDAGAGDDKVSIKTAVAYAAATSTNAGDSILGGAGTDTLSVDGDLAAADMSGAISGFEVLEFTADATGTNMATNKLGINQFVMTNATTDIVLTGLSNNASIKVKDAASGTATDGDITATIGTDTTADVISVEMESTSGSTITLNNYDTLNLSSTKATTDASTVSSTADGIAATTVSALNISGTQALTITTAALKANAAVTSTSTGNVTSTFTTALASYTGSTGNDVLSLAAGNLAQGKTFAGGTGADVLNATASASQDLGIVGLTGFETVNLTANGANVADFRNVTDLATLSVTATAAGTDDLTFNRLSSDTTLSFASGFDQVTTTINSGTSQKVAVSAAATIVSLTLDSGTTSLTITADDGNTTAAEAMADFTAISGTSLATITVLGKDDVTLNTLSTTVTSVDASASTGNLSVTASATATSIIGSQAADAITGGGAVDTIQGGKGADVLDGAAGADVFVFEATGANNGADIFSVGGVNKLVAGAGGDVLNFKNFLSGGAVDQNGGAGTAITAYSAAATTDVNITNKVVLLADQTGTATTAVDEASEIAALIQGSGNVFSLTSGGKAIIVAGDTESDGGSATSELLYIYYVDDTLDGVSGTVNAADVVLVGTTTQDFDLDTLISTNFAFA